MKHKAGFVNIVGNPNVGKSTLMNQLVGERISIATFKAQTTRHRIMGIVNTPEMQIVFSDTPGVLKPNYKLQESMLAFSESALQDADILLYVTDVVENPENRCYLCKHALFSRMVELAQAHGLAAVVDGSNLDDDGDYRPGRRALQELGIVSPLHAAGMTKADIRTLSKERGLVTWDKPSFACLASRFAYGETLTAEGLDRVNQAEEFLMAKGFRQLRVRVHEDGTLARIELLPEDIGRFFATAGLREETEQKLRALGFRYVSLDLRGFRSGSMNEGLNS